MLHRIVRPSVFSGERELLDHGGDIASAGSDSAKAKGQTRIQDAAYEGDLEQVAVLLAMGDTNHQENTSPYTAIQAATSRGHENIVRLLVESGADVNSMPPLSELHTPLCEAVATMNEPIVKYLLDHGADPNMSSKKDVPLLLVSCSRS